MWTETILLGELWSLLCSVQSWDFLPSVTENLRQPPLWAHAQALFLLCAPSLCLLLPSCQDLGGLNIPQILQWFLMWSSEDPLFWLPSCRCECWSSTVFARMNQDFHDQVIGKRDFSSSVSTCYSLKFLWSSQRREIHWEQSAKTLSPEPLEWEHWLPLDYLDYPDN